MRQPVLLAWWSLTIPHCVTASAGSADISIIPPCFFSVADCSSDGLPLPPLPDVPTTSVDVPLVVSPASPETIQAAASADYLEAYIIIPAQDMQQWDKEQKE